MDYSWSPRHSRFFATPFAGIISGLGIICGPIWGSFVVLGSFAGRDHLRGRTDLLSPYRFVAAVETLASAIRQNSDIKGIYIEEQETKLLQYADDTTSILADTN